MNKSNPKHVIPAVCAAALLLALAAFFIITPAASAAITDNVPYIDENGDTLNHDSVTVLDSPGSIAAVHGSGNTLTAGWYVVVGSFTFSDTIFINGDVHLILSDNCSLTVNGSGTDAGISVTGGDSLTVYGQSVSAATMGSLDATADAVEFFGPSAGVTVISGSGIGGGAGLSCGDITINGGMITATGGFAAACTLTLNATATAITGAGIGGMGGAADGTIRINGGVVIATGGEAQAGTLGTTVLDTPVALSGAGIGGAGSTSGGIIEINGGRIEATAGEVYDFEDSGITYTGGPNSLLGPGAGIGGGADSDGNMIIINDGDIVAVSPPGIRSGSAGIGGGVGGSGGTIIINGGTITATCEAQITAGAGIGGGAHLVGGIVTGGSGGNITITGGTITASGGGTMGSGGAGIGGGNNGTGGIITITGGTVTANAGGLAAGIGGGGPGGMPGGGTGGIITITGGRVTANGGTSAAGIGGGGLAGGGTILIYGEQTYVSAVGGAQSLGNGTGGTGGNVFALVMYENLRGTGDSILGTARFTAAPWSYDTVKAILPAPFGVTIELFEGLTAETWMSLQTTLTSPTLIDFVLDDYDNSPVAKAVASFASATDNLVAFSTSYNTITVTLEGDGYVEVGQGGKTYGTVTVSGSEVYVPTRVTDVVLTAVPGAGSVFVKWKEDLSGINPVYNLSIGSDIFVTAEFGIISPTPTTRNYYITATADAGATVSPAGQRTVQKGDSAAFAFSAKEGYSISAVIVDGVQLSRTEIGKGYYTFTNVQANHTIEVKSIAGPRTDMFLSISIVEGNGRAEYSVNNSAFVVYTATVGLPDHADLVVIAYAADGYQFVRWETPAVYTTPEISFNDVMAGIHLDVYFTSDDSPAFEISWITLVIIAIILLLLAGILLWLIFFHRRYYEIKIEGSSRIIGEERVHRKSAYTFAVEGGYSGIIVYRVGEDGEWRPLSPGADGKYVIPRNEVTDNIYLEERNQ